MHGEGIQTDYDAPQAQVSGRALISRQRLSFGLGLSLSQPWQPELGQNQCWVSHTARLVVTYFGFGGELLQ